ncbi:MAG: flavodoxin family protein [Candidatus Helarchaeota archaeon]
MRALVVYFSKTGNTKKIAQAIHETIEGEKQLVDLSEQNSPSIENLDVIFLGSPVWFMKLQKTCKKFLEDLPNGLEATIAVFTTHGVPIPEHYEGAFKQARKICKKKNLKLFNQLFTCQGKHEMIPELAKIFPDRVEAAKTSDTHPDDEDLENARIFAIKVIKSIS